MILRGYQREIFDNVYGESTNDLVQLDTGAGKTPIEVEIFGVSEYAMIVAHRNVLITQCSTVVAKFGIEHDTVSSEFTRRRCMQSHCAVGKNYIRRGHSNKIVASISSLVSHYRHGRLQLDRHHGWVIIIDEAHHVIPDNQWGMLPEIFPNARFVGFTATPGRMDGASLSVRNGGLFDRLVQCEWLRDNSVKKLIANGNLCAFSLYTPVETLNRWRERGSLEIAETPLNAYKRYMHGQPAIVMCPSIKNAKEIANEFRSDGISSASISSDMSGTEVWRVISNFINGRIKVLCNVDMVGEGFDVPEVVGLIIARYTKSFTMYRQWVGRALRPSANKPHAIIVDLVGMVIEHGEPDENVIWDIDTPPRTPQFRRRAPCCACGLWYAIDEEYCPECGEANALIRQTGIGGHYVNLIKADTGLIATKKQELETRDENERLRTVLSIPTSAPVSGILGKTIVSVRESFAQSLVSSGVPIFDVNQFINRGDIAANITFWTTNFTAKHAKNMPPGLAMRVYKKCKKQH
ncbi:DEAD/DEAH box helicase family protein [Pectobacterium carotovorum]|uniref:DEAD/DEAH box helicase n=1 Tax=Pectobacterium carotovorum TaxID=554 RepID=UPI0032EBB283